MTAPIVLPWPLRSGLEAATRALFDRGDQIPNRAPTARQSHVSKQAGRHQS